MRRLVAIQWSIAVVLWVLGALCVGAEVRHPGFWYSKVGAVEHSSEMVAACPVELDRDVVKHATGQQTTASVETPVASSPEPAAQTNEVAAEQQASQTVAGAASKAAAKTAPEDSHTRLIIISIPDRKLALLVDGVLAKVYPIAVGAKHSPSPEGEYTLINHSVNPTYRHKDITIEPGKANPLGNRWMGLSLKGYGIHGTNVQSSIGKATSHGCFRMKKKDVEELYALVQLGDPVSVRGQRDEQTAQLFAAPVTPLMAKADAPLHAAGASKSETEIASAAQNVASVAGGGGQ